MHIRDNMSVASVSYLRSLNQYEAAPRANGDDRNDANQTTQRSVHPRIARFAILI